MNNSNKEEIKAREITPTVQSAMIYNYVRIGNWDKLFNKINKNKNKINNKNITFANRITFYNCSL